MTDREEPGEKPKASPERVALGKAIFPIVLLATILISSIPFFMTDKVKVGLPLSFALFVGIMTPLISMSIVSIPAKPPHVALLKILGARTGEVIKEGIHFLPLNPWVYDAIPIKVEKQEYDYVPVTAVLPDTASVSMTVSTTFKVGEAPEELNRLVDSGGVENFLKISQDIVDERVRELLTSKTEGPLTWQEAQSSQEDTVAVLAAWIFEDTLPGIKALTEKIKKTSLGTVLDYFKRENRRPEDLSEDEKKSWGDKWPKVLASLGGLTEDAFKELEKAVEDARGEIGELRSGKSSISMNKFGIRILRLNITKITVDKDVTDAAKRIAIEALEQTSEMTDLETVKRGFVLLDAVGMPRDQIAPLINARDKLGSFAYNETRISGTENPMERSAIVVANAMGKVIGGSTDTPKKKGGK